MKYLRFSKSNFHPDHIYMYVEDYKVREDNIHGALNTFYDITLQNCEWSFAVNQFSVKPQMGGIINSRGDYRELTAEEFVNELTRRIEGMNPEYTLPDLFDGKTLKVWIEIFNRLEGTNDSSI